MKKSINRSTWPMRCNSTSTGGSYRGRRNRMRRWQFISRRDDSTVVWVPLIDVTKNLGTLQVVPRSHTEGLVTIKSEEGFGIVNKYKDNDFISIELSKGDALFFSSCLVHRSGINITDSIRWSSHFRYNNMEDSDFIKRQYPHPYIYKPSSKIEPE